MDPILKQIKTELKPICQEENLKLKHIKNHFQEVLEYHDYYGLNRKKHFLLMRFILQKQEKSLSFVYRHVHSNRNGSTDESYSFADADQMTLPGITKTRQEKLLNLYQYQVEEGKIVNTVPLEEQYAIIIDVFKNSYKNIIKHAKNLNKTKKSLEE